MDFLRQLIEQISSIWKKLEVSQKLTILAVMIGFLISLLLLVSYVKQPEYGILYSNLTSEDAGNVINKLREKKIPYRLEQQGRTILIPSSQVYETRIDLAMEGIPKGGEVGFEIFDKTNLGMSSFMEKINYQRALQGELSRTIQGLSEVLQARVHLTIPEPTPFIEEEKPPTAAVVLKLRPGARLNKNQIYGIAYLVASSVEGLEPENVSIIDEKGNMLFGGKDSSYLTSSQLELKRSVEQYLTDKISSLLTSVLGPNKVVARINAELNFDHIQRTEERYSPKGKVVQSETRDEELRRGMASLIAGVPGVSSNIGNESISNSTAPQEERREKSSVQYALNKTVEHLIREAGNIEKLSIAVMIDGTYRTTKDGKRQYIPRSEEEMEKLTSIIKAATGYDEGRGDTITVANVPFDTSYREEERLSMERLARQELLRYLVKYLLIGVSLLILFLLARSLIKGISLEKRKTEEVVSPEEEIMREKRQAAFAEEELIRKQIHQLVDKSPEEAARIIRIWLKEGGNGSRL